MHIYSDIRPTILPLLDHGNGKVCLAVAVERDFSWKCSSTGFY